MINLSHFSIKIKNSQDYIKLLLIINVATLILIIRSSLSYNFSLLLIILIILMSSFDVFKYKIISLHKKFDKKNSLDINKINQHPQLSYISQHWIFINSFGEKELFNRAEITFNAGLFFIIKLSDKEIDIFEYFKKYNFRILQKYISFIYKKNDHKNLVIFYDQITENEFRHLKILDKINNKKKQS